MTEQSLLANTVYPDSSRDCKQTGFSLIELMVSIALGLLIMTGVLALYLDLSRSNAELAKMNRQIENGRFTIQLLQQELWRAGFWDSYVPLLPSAVPPAAIPNPCTDFSSWSVADIADIYMIPVQGYVAGSVLPAECSGIVSNQQADSDMIVIRYASTCVAGATNCESYDANKLYLQSQLCGEASHANYVASAADLPVLDTPGASVYRKDCVTPVNRRKLVTSIFYVRNYSVTTSDGIPTLMRADLDLNGGVIAMQSAQPVIEGIQSIKFEYGQDTNDDGAPDFFSDCAACGAVDWANIVAVRMHVLARNLEVSTGYVEDKSYVLGSVILGPFNDGFKRHAYTSYVHLVNPSGRRERP